MKAKKEGISITALILCGLILSFALVFITDGARFLFPAPKDELLVELLLENMDGAAAAALMEETEFSVDGGASCRLLEISPPVPQMQTAQHSDGRILSLPSGRLFTARLTLLVEGQRNEEGFLAFGTHRLLVGAGIRLDGKRMTAEGRILSLSTQE